MGETRLNTTRVKKVFVLNTKVYVGSISLFPLSLCMCLYLYLYLHLFVSVSLCVCAPRGFREKNPPPSVGPTPILSTTEDYTLGSYPPRQSEVHVYQII